MNEHFFEVNLEIFTTISFYVGFLGFSLVAYLLGSINTAHILDKIWKKDIGTTGSKNYGATNASRVYGLKGFIITFLTDIAKTILSVLIIYGLVALINHFLVSDLVKESLIDAMILSLVFILIGHSYPIYFHFKGGKGVACAFGLICIINWFFGLLVLLIFLILLNLFKKVGIASVFSVLTGSFLLLFQPLFWENLIFAWTETWLIWVSGTFVSLFIIFKHRENLNWYLEELKRKKTINK